MWKYDNEYRFQSDDSKVIDKMRRRSKFRQVSRGDVVIFQTAKNSLRDAKKTLGILGVGSVKKDTLEGVYVA